MGLSPQAMCVLQLMRLIYANVLASQLNIHNMEMMQETWIFQDIEIQQLYACWI